MADRAMRRGFKNNDQKPSRARSLAERLGARYVALVWIINCCFKRKFSAMIVLPPLDLSSFATVVSRWNVR